MENLEPRKEKIIDNSAKELELFNDNFNDCLPVETGDNKRRLSDMFGLDKYMTIKTLREKGYSRIGIAKMLECSPKTVRKILRRLESGGEIIIERRPQVKMLDCYRDYIIPKVEEGLSAIRIYQDLVSEKGYEGSYRTVALYVKGLREVVDVYVRLHSLAGEECQVDFGYVGRVIWCDGKLRGIYVFSMGLSYSRLRYYEAVFSQDVKTFLKCHINGFRFFNGVPKVVKIDNLKSGILEASFYEPLYQQEYLRFANYYGFKPVACRIRTPTDKGKAEANIKYVKNNFFKGRLFRGVTFEEGLLLCNRELTNWVNNICNRKIHGTTKEVPIEKFSNEEANALIPLPSVDYEIAEWVKRKVNIDSHINFKNNYYSVPYEYVGKEVAVEVKDRLIKIYADNQVVATHIRCNEKGKFITNNTHYPGYKVLTESEYCRYYRDKMMQIGENALAYYEEMLKRKGYGCYRALRGIIDLSRRYGGFIVDKACKRAMMYEAYGYRVIKSICERHLYGEEVEQIDYPDRYGGTFSRPLGDYAVLFDDNDTIMGN